MMRTEDRYLSGFVSKFKLENTKSGLSVAKFKVHAGHRHIVAMMQMIFTSEKSLHGQLCSFFFYLLHK